MVTASETATRLMSTLAEPLHERRTAGDLPALPACSRWLILSSLVILAHLGVVLWLAWTSGSPGNPDLTYTAATSSRCFSDARTYSVLLDTFAFALVSLAVALAFGIPAAWLAERTDFPRQDAALHSDGDRPARSRASRPPWAGCSCCIRASGCVNQFLVTHVRTCADRRSTSRSLLGMGCVQGSTSRRSPSS